ncbi:hypothetical protein S40285_04715 [Stachybotrys chlorohalonatus IBT 40285]|uniref:alpha-galactosidase n=1 Tax=Stachybotrys chlorohalonatus (strain IBT 40285) TaxID=1283841 RepID=A0A084Q9V7_STAC4|nr:hypothetical protein S40285_04715 [Stachybotrys chlorohalonata IBT 40285]
MYTRSLCNLAPLWAVVCVVLVHFAGLSHATSPIHERQNENERGRANVGRSPARRQSPIWQPVVGASWQIVLYGAIATLEDAGDINPDVDIYDLDMFDNEMQTFEVLQAAGKRVICYFSAGSWEEWRDDAGDFDEQDLGSELDGWPGERWVNISSPGIREIMSSRIALAASRGCDAVDPDNVDGFGNENGLGLTAQDSIDFVRFLAEEAHSHNMAIGLKNAGDIIEDVLDVVQFSVNEQCIEYSECEVFEAFINADKPVFHIEYPESAPELTDGDFDRICSSTGDAAGSGEFSKVIKEMDVLGWVKYCDGSEHVTELA